MRRQAHIVVDLGFGDAGKGTVTDSLVRQTNAELVVRFNGGAQAGHTVVLPDGHSHTFSQFGAGTFVPGTRTHLSQFVLVHPGGLIEEARALGRQGVGDALARLSIDPEALVITPFQQSANRLRELLRGEARHGSCGLGVGETAQDALQIPELAIRAHELAAPAHHNLRAKLRRLQQQKWELFARQRSALLRTPQGGAELAVLESPEVVEAWLGLLDELSRQVEIAPLKLPSRVVFEGAQGVLLDEWRGFHPHTTWSTCTFDNAMELLDGWTGEVHRWGVLRSYATRHGAGPFPTEEPSLRLPEPHNGSGLWQGDFRRGWLDLVLAHYAVECCGGINATALTHLDCVDHRWRVADRYEELDPCFYRAGRLRLGEFRDLSYQQALGEAVSCCRPCYRAVDAECLPDLLQEALGAPVALVSSGPCPQDKRYTASICG